MEAKTRLRKWRNSDVPFITSNWLRSFRDGAFARGVPNSIYFFEEQRQLSEVNRRASIIMVCDEADDNKLYGFVCVEKDVTGALIFHYLYIKPEVRKRGLARKLIETVVDHETKTRGSPPPAIFYTHKTFDILDYRKECEEQNKPWGLRDWVYNPYMFFARPQVATCDPSSKRPSTSPST